jgi:hypothetical protein
MITSAIVFLSVVSCVVHAHDLSVSGTACDEAAGLECPIPLDEEVALLQTDVKVKSFRTDDSKPSVWGDIQSITGGGDSGEDESDSSEESSGDSSSQLADVTGTNMEDTNRNHDHCPELLNSTNVSALTKCSCNATSIVKLPLDDVCPETCPFSQEVNGEPCFKLCVFHDACADFHMARKFASTRVMECVPTCGKNTSDHIPGCLTCADFGVCGQCQDGFKLGPHGKECIIQASTSMTVFWRVLYVLLVIVILFLIALCCRPKVNQTNFRHCQEYMYRCAPSYIDNSSGRPVWSAYPVWKSSVLKKSEPIGGIGTMLMYRFLIFMGICTLALAAGIGITYELSDYGQAHDAAMNVAACPSANNESNASSSLQVRLSLLEQFATGIDFKASQFANTQRPIMHVGSNWMIQHRVWGDDEDGTPKSTADTLRANVDKKAKMDGASLLRLRRQNFVVMSVLYILIVLASFAFGWHILKIGQEYDDETSSMKDFVVSISGLPKAVFDAELLENYLKATFNCSLVGVSVAYDYYDEHNETVEAAVDSWLLEEEATRGLVFEVDGLPQPPAHPEEPADSSGTPESPISSTITHQVVTGKIVDGFIIGESDDSSLQKSEVLSEEQVTEVTSTLEQIQCSGRAYAVLNTQKDVQAVLDAADTTTPLFDFKGTLYKLRLNEVWSEPEDIQWWYHKKDMGYNWKIPLSILICFGTMILYFVSLIPLVKVYMGMTQVPGVQANFLNEILLGALPGIGGALMCIAVDLCSEWVGYLERDRRDVTVGLGAFALTCVTVVGDLYLTLQIAQGSSLDSAFSGSAVPFDAELAREVYAMVVPAYVLCVAVIPTLVETNLPYYFFGSIVKTRPVPRRLAEKTMKVTPFENIYRYSDTISGICAMWTMLFFLSPEDWKGLVGCVAMVALQYVFSKWQMLRVYSKMCCNSERLAWHGLHWWSVPLCMLFAASLMWGVQGEILPWGCARFGFPAHFVLYFLGLKQVKKFIPDRIEHQDTYKQMADRMAAQGEFATMFNTNPVHCLRQKYNTAGKTKGIRFASRQTPQIVPWILGKEHLQPGAPVRVKRQVGFFAEMLGRTS